MKKVKKNRELRWHKLDNTANVFPVVSGKNLSNVFRLSVELEEKVDKRLLQEALEEVLVWFDLFNVRLRRGVFWYYFETNRKKPVVEKEVVYPCRYLNPYSNNQYLFRVNYYNNRINLEVFHVVTDGLGASVFLKELVYRYLRKAHPEQLAGLPEGPSSEASFNLEDSYLRYYRPSHARGYKKEKAYQMKGELLPVPTSGLLHGEVDMSQVKAVCRKYNVSITRYYAAVLIWSIYQEYLHGQTSRHPIRINIPANLRGFFPSNTTKNFFAVILTGLKVERGDYTFEEILQIVSDDLERQLTKEHMEELISYNVSNEKHKLVRMIPLFIKNIGIGLIYSLSIKSFTTTLSNLGKLTVLPEYEPYIKGFNVAMGVSSRQPFKCSVIAYQNRQVITFHSVLKDTAVQRTFFRKLAEDGIRVELTSNGVYQYGVQDE